MLAAPSSTAASARESRSPAWSARISHRPDPTHFQKRLAKSTSPSEGGALPAPPGWEQHQPGKNPTLTLRSSRVAARLWGTFEHCPWRPPVPCVSGARKWKEIRAGLSYPILPRSSRESSERCVRRRDARARGGRSVPGMVQATCMGHQLPKMASESVCEGLREPPGTFPGASLGLRKLPRCFREAHGASASLCHWKRKLHQPKKEAGSAEGEVGAAEAANDSDAS